MSLTRITTLALGALGLAALGACSESITGDAQQVGPKALNFAMDVSNARGAPAGGGGIRSYVITSVASPLASDAFQRSGTSGTKIGYGGPSCNSGLGGTKRWCVRTFLRDSVGDPRHPLMVGSGHKGTDVPFIDLGGPEYYGATSGVKAFELYGRIDSLKPNQTYTVSLVRYGLVVNGMLDAVERMIYGRITQPDSLVLIEPNNTTVPGINYNWVSNLGCNNNTTPVNANPFVFGSGTTSGTGRLNFDYCFASDNVFYKNGTTVVPDSAPFLRNSIGPRVIQQQYNYLVVSEGTTFGGPIVSRVQVGADLDPTTGQVIPNAFAPFPSGALSPGTLISTLKVAQGGPNSVTMTLLPIEQLQQGGYRIMLFNRETGAKASARALYQTITRDTTGRDALGNVVFTEDTSDVSVVDAIPGGAGNVTHIITVKDSLNGATLLGQYTDVTLLAPGVDTAATVWLHYLDRKNNDNTQDDVFFDTATPVIGTLPLRENPTPYVFHLAGSAAGVNRGDQIGIEFQHLPRPPIGFFYNVWLVPSAAGSQPVSLGPITTPLPEERSLLDADVEAPSEFLTPTEISDAVLTIRPAQLQQLGIALDSYGTIRLTLEAKAGVPTISPWIVLEGAFPTPQTASTP